MEVFTLKSQYNDWRSKTADKTIGFVPTMGALHNGHIQLVKDSCLNNDLTVVSIFVNPTQFNQQGDLTNYPRTLQKDLLLLEDSGCDAVIVPSVEEIYPSGLENFINIDLGYLDTVMEGAYRPGHFKGVIMVVDLLFKLVKPHKAYFGEKDFQQLLVIKKLKETQNYSIQIVSCPIFREKDGLAYSSRNLLLSKENRAKAKIVPNVLLHSIEMFKKLTIEDLKKWVEVTVNSVSGVSLDYFEVVNQNTLKPISSQIVEEEIRFFIAVKIGGIRLIDNMIAE
ncbi:MAG: pantoate--beta-alanine ligase [Bacteroidia bacterium]|jgi:pantoate--beta-alanine ligase